MTAVSLHDGLNYGDSSVYTCNDGVTTVNVTCDNPNQSDIYELVIDGSCNHLFLSRNQFKSFIASPLYVCLNFWNNQQ